MPRDPLDGVITIKTGTAASAGAGNLDSAMRPAAGEAWEVIDAWLTQDDGAVYVRWLWTDPDVTAQTLWSCTAAGTSDKFHIGSDAGIPTSVQHLAAPVVLTYDRYLTARITASAGSKNVTWVALVRIFRGVPVEA